MTTDNRPDDAEKREFKRVKVSFLVFYKPNQPLHVRMMVGDKEVHAIMYDLSEGGMAIVTNYDIPTNTALSIRFILYNQAAFNNNQRVRPMDMEGEVRYNIPGEHGEFRLGIFFTSILEENKLAISSFVRMAK